MPSVVNVSSGRRRSSARVLWVGAAAGLAVATGILWSGWGGPNTAMIIADTSAIVTALVGALIVLRHARIRTADRAAWTLLGAGMVLWGVGEVIWGYFEMVAGDDVPFPSVADIAYLGAVPFVVAGLLAFARGSGARFHLRTVLDGCLVSASLLFIAWALVLGPAFHVEDTDLWAYAIGIAYPATDLLLAVLALAVVQWGGSRDRAALRMVAAALVLMAAADTAFTWMANNGTYTSSNPVAMLWPLSYLLLTWATRTEARPSSGSRATAETGAELLTPYIPLLGAIAIATPRVLGGHALGSFLTINGIVIVTLVLVRQAVTAWDLRTTVAALHAREAELERLAGEDSLTGLANRASFARHLEAALGGTEEPAVIFIDLDGFKAVNDHFGHATGDELLIEVSERLRARMTGSMVLARLGGDEFVILVPAGDVAAAAVAHDILVAFEVPFDVHGESIPFQASLGIATAPVGGSPDEAVRRADAAMYVAKSTGKGRAVVYPDETLATAIGAAIGTSS